MRGWIYVATAADRGGRVWIGHAAADPATEAGRHAARSRRIEYDAVVPAPRDVVALVRARLAPLATSDGAFRCSPEFAIAAIHHALGGPVEGERIYVDDSLTFTPPRDPVDALAGLAARSSRRERGGALRSLAAPGVVLLIATALALYAGTRPPVRPMPPDAERQWVPGLSGQTASPPPSTADAGPPASAPSVPSAPSAVPADAAPATASPELPAAAPVSAADCRVLWTSTLPRCAAVPKRACGAAERQLAPDDRARLAALREAGTGFNAAAFANFCRAACRHGYRPSREDFSANVCRASR